MFNNLFLETLLKILPIVENEIAHISEDIAKKTILDIKFVIFATIGLYLTTKLDIILKDRAFAHLNF